MVLDSTQPTDSVLLAELPRYIRETRASIENERQEYITGIAVEFGAENYDAVFLDPMGQIFRRSKAGDATRNKVHGIYVLEFNAVKIVGSVTNDAWSFTPGKTIYVSDREYGDYTEVNTGLVGGIAISVDTMIISSTLSEQIDTIVYEISDARLGFATLGQTMRDLSEDLVSVIAEVVAARATSGDLSSRIIDILATESTNNTAIISRVQAIELAMANAVRTYPSLLSLLQAHEAQYKQNSLELTDARDTHLTLKARLESIVRMFDEVTAARAGKLSLLERLTEIALVGSTVTTEVVSARGIYPTLLSRLEYFNANVTEVVEARGTHSDLDGRFMQQAEDLQSILSELVNARGLATTLNSRLNVSINSDGTLKSTVTPVVWFTEASAISKVTGNIFTVATDKTSIYVTGRAVELSDNYYCHAISSSYSAGTGLTTVEVTGSGIADSLTNVAYSFHPNVLPMLAHSSLMSVLGADDTSADTVKTRHVSNSQMKILTDARVLAASNISTLQGQMTTAIADIDAAELLITNHAGRLTTAEGTLTSHGSRLTTAEGKITTLENAASTDAADILALETAVDNMAVFREELMVTKSANFTAALKSVNRIQTAGITITPPAVPVLGDWFIVMPEVDLRSNPVTFNTSSQKFQGLSESLLIDGNKIITLLYTGATYGWTVMN